MRIRPGALAAGLVVALVYATAAFLSGHLSPLARQPLLDGLAPPTAYRWVEPPPELASTNQEPTPGTFGAELGANGSKTEVFTTDDAQLTLILPEGSFASADGQTSVEVTIEPIAPSSVSEPAAPLHLVGNVVLITATYQPSGDVAKLSNLATVVLVYPLLANDHGEHSVVRSPTGTTWKTIQTDDLPSIQQAGADIDRLGYVSVAGRPAAPTAGAETGRSGSSMATIVIVAGLILLAVVAAVLLRGRSRSG